MRTFLILTCLLMLAMPAHALTVYQQTEVFGFGNGTVIIQPPAIRFGPPPPPPPVPQPRHYRHHRPNGHISPPPPPPKPQKRQNRPYGWTRRY